MSSDAPDAPDTTNEATQESGPGATPDEQLGEAGLSALKAERERANAAEKAAKEALARVKEFEDRDKTEAQKQQEALEAAQRELAELTVAKARAEVAAAKGVPAALLTGGTTEELEASADALIAFKEAQASPAMPIVPSAGKMPSDSSVAEDWLRSALN